MTSYEHNQLILEIVKAAKQFNSDHENERQNITMVFSYSTGRAITIMMAEATYFYIKEVKQKILEYLKPEIFID